MKMENRNWRHVISGDLLKDDKGILFASPNLLLIRTLLVLYAYFKQEMILNSDYF